MTAPLPLMTENEIRNCVVDGECGFGCLRTDRGTLPLREMTVEARVIATYAHTTLRQVFVNTLGVPLEATYIFPLPDRAAVTRFTMEVAGRRVEGVLEERMQARRTYDQAIAQGKRASIAEEERPGTFTIRVGNLMPGEAAAITLEMSGALPVADGEVTYRFPLVVAPRYMPGHALGGDNVGDGTAADTDAVPDASRISPPVLLPGMASPVRLGISVELDAAGLPLSNVRSSLHAAYADERAGRFVVRTVAGERLNRDFILRFQLGDAASHTSARLFRDSYESTFAVTLLPPTLNIQAKAKDVCFVIDRSGSMQGWKMVAARRATARMIDALRMNDRFSVIAFDSTVEEFQTGLLEATDRNRFKASQWLAQVDARGGTEMAAPLARAADLLSTTGGFLERDRVLVFVTDGQVGNEAQLVKLLGQRLRGARVFALGIDQAVNAGFLNRLAALGRQGDAELVESEDRLDEVLQRVHRRVDVPVIAELSLDVQGAQLVPGTLAPSQLPDVFPGVPATICGRLAGGAGGAGYGATFVVRGRLADGSRFEQRINGDEVMNPAIRAAWARMHLRDLEDRFDANQGNKSELERRIVDVSLRNNVLCRFTAFVAVDHAEVVNRGGWQHHATQPVEQPAGWGGAAPDAARAVGGSPSMPMPMPMSTPMQPQSAGRAEMKKESIAVEKSLECSGFDAMSVAPPPPAAAAAPASPMPAGASLPVARPAPQRQEEARLSRRRASSASTPPPMDAPAEPGAPLDRTAVADSRKQASVLGAVRDAVGGIFGGKAKEAAPSLAAFAVRLRELVELAKRRSQDLFGIARELEQRLRLLIEDMAHAGVAADDRRGLEEAQRMIRDAVLSGDSLSVERALDLAEDILDRAAGGAGSSSSSSSPPTPRSGKREGFWR